MRSRDGARFAFFDAEGAELELTARGWRMRPTLIAIPSGPGFSHKTLRPWLLPLVEQLRVAYVDLPGVGMGSLDAGQDYGFESYAADLDDVRRHLGAEMPILLGHGWGSTLAVEYALAHPTAVAALVLINPLRVFSGAGQDGEAQARMVAKADSSLFERWARDIAPLLQAALRGESAWEPLERHPWWNDMVRTQFATPPPEDWSRSLAGEPWGMRAYASYKGAAASEGTSMAQYDLAERARGLAPDLPVLIVSSNHDANYVALAARHAALVHSALPRSELVMWDHVGHFPFVERPADFAACVVDFLERADVLSK